MDEPSVATVPAPAPTSAATTALRHVCHVAVAAAAAATCSYVVANQASLTAAVPAKYQGLALMFAALLAALYKRSPMSAPAQ